MTAVGWPSWSVPVSPLKPNMWSKARFSSISTKTWSMAGTGWRGPRNWPSNSVRATISQRAVSPATQTRDSTQENTTHPAMTTQVKAMHTHFATQYQAWQTQFATQYQARQKKPAMQFQGVYQWHLDQLVHWLEPSSAHCEHWLDPSSAHCEQVCSA